QAVVNLGALGSGGSRQQTPEREGVPATGSSQNGAQRRVATGLEIKFPEHVAESFQGHPLNRPCGDRRRAASGPATSAWCWCGRRIDEVRGARLPHRLDFGGAADRSGTIERGSNRVVERFSPPAERGWHSGGSAAGRPSRVHEELGPARRDRSRRNDSRRKQNQISNFSLARRENHTTPGNPAEAVAVVHVDEAVPEPVLEQLRGALGVKSAR